MYFKVKKDFVFYLINILNIFFLFFYILLYLVNRRISDLISLGIFAFLGIIFLPIFFNSYYILDTNSLKITFGFMKIIIPYKNISGLEMVKRNIASISMSNERIEIKYKGKNMKDTYVDISPIERIRFLKMLEKKCIEEEGYWKSMTSL